MIVVAVAVAIIISEAAQDKEVAEGIVEAEEVSATTKTKAKDLTANHHTIKQITTTISHLVKIHLVVLRTNCKLGIAIANHFTINKIAIARISLSIEEVIMAQTSSITTIEATTKTEEAVEHIIAVAIVVEEVVEAQVALTMAMPISILIQMSQFQRRMSMPIMEL